MVCHPPRRRRRARRCPVPTMIRNAGQRSPSIARFAAVVRLEVAAAKERDRIRLDTPPSSEVLTQVWHAWHRLPTGMSADERRDLLLGNPSVCRNHPRWVRLLNSCPGFPFSGAACNTVLVAWRWMRVREQLRVLKRTAKARNRVRQAEAFLRPDHVLVGALGLARTEREMLAVDPGYFRRKAPSLAQIQEFEERRRAYDEARCDAQQRLFAALLGTAPDSDPAGSNSHVASQVADLDTADLALIARLEAMGICPPVVLHRFLSERLPFLPPAVRQHFYRLARLSRHGKDRLVPLQVWLADNAPVICRFRLRPGDLRDAARARGIPVCSSVRQLTKLRAAWKLPFRFGQGVPPPRSAGQSQAGLSLLSPAPNFTLLHGDSA